MTTSTQLRKRSERFLIASSILLVLAAAVALVTADTTAGLAYWLAVPLALAGIGTLIVSFALDKRSKS